MDKTPNYLLSILNLVLKTYLGKYHSVYGKVSKLAPPPYISLKSAIGLYQKTLSFILITTNNDVS